MTQSKDTLVFNGFEPANTTPVPDVLFDVLLPYLNEAQLKVMLYIIRRTLGFKKTADAISLNQFRWGITTKDGKKLDNGCGLKNFTTISKALKELEQMNCIESDKRETDEGNNLTTVYRIRFMGTTQNVVGTTDSVVGVLRQTYDRTTPNGGRVLRQTESQETVIQQTDKQETVIQERERISAPESDATFSPPDVGDSRAFSSSGENGSSQSETPSQQGDRDALLDNPGLPAPVASAGDADERDRQDIRLVALQPQEIDNTFSEKENLPTTQPAQPLPSGIEQAVSGQCHFCTEQAELTCRVCGKRVCYFEHGRRFPLSKTEVEDYCLPCLEAHNAAVTKAIAAQQNQSAGTPNGAMVGDDLLSNPPAQGAASPKPLTEPDMSGKWSNEMCVAYAEWCNKKRYTDKMREEQLKAAQTLHKQDASLTLEQFKQAYDERNDAWWQEHKGKLHVNDMKAKGTSGIPRVYEMLQRIEDAATRSKVRQISTAPRSTVKRYSSYDDPNFRSDQDFYPVEGGSYAAASY